MLSFKSDTTTEDLADDLGGLFLGPQYLRKDFAPKENTATSYSSPQYAQEDFSRKKSITSREDLVDLSRLREEEKTDYQEGLMETDDMTAYIGSLKVKGDLKYDQTVAPYRADRKSNIGKVLNPEGRGEKWSYKKNQAFMLGAIEAGKTFILVTPKSHYDSSFITGTIDELLWLKDNGYTFYVRNDDTVACHPPIKRSSPIIRNYHNGNGIYNQSSMNDMREEILGFTSPTYTPYRSKTLETGSRPQYLSTPNTDNGISRNKPGITVGS
ncbi:hypothetical protein [Candidatus Berkiella aquae]|uniref:Uncharacterized protein n=1 Tax=Candidatus Berkiella aquae TaxID=295108 RepID=A0A0Q9YLK5_9GAMM|nr:hypothetical protein [Candidatus Berkiella aquae]MCS5711534.1 hypothetical protein [Candidatus Berkiella aquae]